MIFGLRFYVLYSATRQLYWAVNTTFLIQLFEKRGKPKRGNSFNGNITIWHKYWETTIIMKIIIWCHKMFGWDSFFVSLDSFAMTCSIMQDDACFLLFYLIFYINTSFARRRHLVSSISQSLNSEYEILNIYIFGFRLAGVRMLMPAAVWWSEIAMIGNCQYCNKIVYLICCRCEE